MTAAPIPASGDADAAAPLAAVGRVLDSLRTRASAGPVLAVGASRASPVAREPITMREAVERYEAGPLAMLAKGTRTTYAAWARRVAAEYGDRDPATLATGDLRDLIATWIVRIRELEAQPGPRAPERQGSGGGRRQRSAPPLRLRHREAVGAREHRHGAAQVPETRRRPWRPEEAALVRQFARSRGRDGLLNEVTVTIPERMGLRREEMYRLRMCDLDLERRVAAVQGKGNRPRDTPIPPVLAELLTRFIEDRRPAHIPRDAWLRSSERVLRTRPTDTQPMGHPAGWNRPDDLFNALREAALFVNRDQSLHCYRHTLGSWIEPRYGRKATRNVLGHHGHRESTDYYIHVPLVSCQIEGSSYSVWVMAAQ